MNQLRFAVTHHLPGYLSESDPFILDADATEADALDALIEEAQWQLEPCFDCACPDADHSLCNYTEAVGDEAMLEGLRKAVDMRGDAIAAIESRGHYSVLLDAPCNGYVVAVEQIMVCACYDNHEETPCNY